MVSMRGHQLYSCSLPQTPLPWLVLVQDYNGVGITQTSGYIEVSCKGYTNRPNKPHGWGAGEGAGEESKPTAPTPPDAISRMFAEEDVSTFSELPMRVF